MKSVIQEGTSLSKAIEQGWVKAGRPKEFTVKIFQEAQKNFFGMTTVPAKVGIFFREAAILQETKEVRTERKPQHRQRQYNQKRKFNNPREDRRDREKSSSHGQGHPRQEHRQERQERQHQPRQEQERQEQPRPDQGFRENRKPKVHMHPHIAKEKQNVAKDQKQNQEKNQEQMSINSDEKKD